MHGSFLHCAATNGHLVYIVPCLRLSRYGRRSFSVASPTTWTHWRDPDCTSASFGRFLESLFRVYPSIRLSINPSMHLFQAAGPTIQQNVKHADDVLCTLYGICLFAYWLVTGLSCDKCATGYYRSSAADADLQCSSCNCGGRADTDPPLCDHLTGVCLNCRPGTTGPHCEECATHVDNADTECRTCESGYWGIDVDGCRGLYFWKSVNQSINRFI